MSLALWGRADFLRAPVPSACPSCGVLSAPHRTIVCVSHIDDDHITGILRLVEDEVEWRAFEFAQTIDADTAEPRVARPPEIG